MKQKYIPLYFSIGYRYHYSNRGRINRHYRTKRARNGVMHRMTK